MTAICLYVVLYLELHPHRASGGTGGGAGHGIAADISTVQSFVYGPAAAAALVRHESIIIQRFAQRLLGQYLDVPLARTHALTAAAAAAAVVWRPSWAVYESITINE